MTVRAHFVNVLGHQMLFGGEMGAASGASLLLYASRDRILITTPGCCWLLQAALLITEYFLIYCNAICNSPKLKIS